MQHLLDDVYDIVLTDRKESEEKFRRGELFNIFDILKLQTNEVKTHSAFIRELLDPKGSHGMKDEFLKLFISSLDIFDNWTFNTSNAQVKVEESAGKINEKGTEGGRVDIVIKSSEKVIIIENKIYAGDQKNQLIRYANYGKDYQDYRLLYLTLNGHTASNYSCGKMTDQEDYYTISYQNHILSWLRMCLDVCKNNDQVFLSIKQYSNLIKELTGQMENDQNKEKILDILTSKENAIKTATILDNYNELYWEFVDKFITEELRKWVKLKGWECIEDEGEFWYQIYPKGWKHHCIVFEDYKNKENYFSIGVLKLSGRQHKQMQLNILEDGINQYWPFGYSDCTNKMDAMEKIASGKSLKYIIDTVESIIKELTDRRKELQELNIEL